MVKYFQAKTTLIFCMEIFSRRRFPIDVCGQSRFSKLLDYNLLGLAMHLQIKSNFEAKATATNTLATG